MATPNYAYEKRQRELAKKRKKEEKATRKTHDEPAANPGMGYGTPVGSTGEVTATAEPQSSASGN